jgi:hypothetical protein
MGQMIKMLPIWPLLNKKGPTMAHKTYNMLEICMCMAKKYATPKLLLAKAEGWLQYTVPCPYNLGT